MFYLLEGVALIAIADLPTGAPDWHYAPVCVRRALFADITGRVAAGEPFEFYVGDGTARSRFEAVAFPLPESVWLLGVSPEADYFGERFAWQALLRPYALSVHWKGGYLYVGRERLSASEAWRLFAYEFWREWTPAHTPADAPCIAQRLYARLCNPVGEHLNLSA